MSVRSTTPSALHPWFTAALVLFTFGTAIPTTALGDELTHGEASAALRRAVTFYRERVSTEGGYLWQYAPDLTAREGERAADADTVWVQPPGTPTVGQALLEAWGWTGDRACLDAARDAGRALVRGQLVSGGWDYRIHFDEQRRGRYAYRVEVGPEDAAGRRNTTTLDDDTTQSALRFLLRLDRALEFENEQVHEAVVYGLRALRHAQYPNGAWPQRFSGVPDGPLFSADDFPVRKAGYPDQWSREFPGRDYKHDYTFNDNSIRDVVRLLFEAAEVYEEPAYRRAAERGGAFILLAQMPEPQPAWAQQYDRHMHPSWARKFEPPAVTGGESQGVLRTLLFLYERTGDEKYLEPVPRALAYLQKSRLEDGRLARFYELRTNRPLYFTREYELTYSDDDLPTHYGFQVGSKLDSIEAAYERLQARRPEPRPLVPPPRRDPPRLARSLANRAREVVDALDERGAWVEPGSLRRAGRTEGVISTRTFVKNLETLARYVAATR